MEFEQMTLEQFLKPKDWSYNRKGQKVEASDWIAGKKRCEHCHYWSLLPVEEQPAEGWGVFGICTSHRGQGRQKPEAGSYCDDFERSGE